LLPDEDNSDDDRSAYSSIGDKKDNNDAQLQNRATVFEYENLSSFSENQEEEKKLCSTEQAKLPA